MSNVRCPLMIGTEIAHILYCMQSAVMSSGLDFDCICAHKFDNLEWSNKAGAELLTAVSKSDILR